jgi:hypothetical protein
MIEFGRMEQGLGTRQESLDQVWGFAVSVVLAHQVRRCRCCRRRRNHRPLLNIASYSSHRSAAHQRVDHTRFPLPVSKPCPPLVSKVCLGLIQPSNRRVHTVTRTHHFVHNHPE